MYKVIGLNSRENAGRGVVREGHNNCVMGYRQFWTSSSRKGSKTNSLVNNCSCSWKSYLYGDVHVRDTLMNKNITPGCSIVRNIFQSPCWCCSPMGCSWVLVLCCTSYKHVQWDINACVLVYANWDDSCVLIVLYHLQCVIMVSRALLLIHAYSRSTDHFKNNNILGLLETKVSRCQRTSWRYSSRCP